MGLPWQHSQSAPVCVCVGGGRNFLPFFFFIPPCSVTGARHAVIGQALWEKGDGTILTPGPPSPSPDKGFSWTRKSFKPVKDQRARSVKTSLEAALLPLLLLSVWSYADCESPPLTGCSWQGQMLLLELTHYSLLQIFLKLATSDVVIFFIYCLSILYIFIPINLSNVIDCNLI